MKGKNKSTSHHKSSEIGKIKPASSCVNLAGFGMLIMFAHYE